MEKCPSSPTENPFAGQYSAHLGGGNGNAHWLIFKILDRRFIAKRKKEKKIILLGHNRGALSLRLSAGL